MSPYSGAALNIEGPLYKQYVLQINNKRRNYIIKFKIRV